MIFDASDQNHIFPGMGSETMMKKAMLQNEMQMKELTEWMTNHHDIYYLLYLFPGSFVIFEQSWFFSSKIKCTKKLILHQLQTTTWGWFTWYYVILLI